MRLDKAYTLSVWEDFNDNGSPSERELLLIGSNEMESQYRILNPKLTINVNGTSNFSFDMYYQFVDIQTGDLVQNPYCELVKNEAKLRLVYDNETYFFVVKNIKKDENKKSYNITCESQYVNELSKNGYNVQFAPELHNNTGTATELAKKALEDTDWTVAAVGSGSDFLPRQQEESLVRLRVSTAFTAQHIVETQTPPYGITDNTTITIPINAIIYAFYSCCKERSKRFQFLWTDNYNDNPVTQATDGIFKTTDRLIIEPNRQYYIDIDSAYYTDIGNGIYTYNNCVVSPQEDGAIISTKYRGNRYVYSAPTVYVDKLKAYAQVGQIGGVDVYRTTETEYVSPNLIQNYVTNPNNFEKINGWRVARSANQQDLPDLKVETEQINSQGQIIVGGQSLFNDLINNTYNVNNHYQSFLHIVPKVNGQFVTNSGLYDNRRLFKKNDTDSGISAKKEFRISLKYRSNCSFNLFIAKEDNSNGYSYDITNQVYTINDNDYIIDVKSCSSTNNQPLEIHFNKEFKVGFTQKELDSAKLKIFFQFDTISQSSYLDIYDFQIYEAIIDEDGDYITPINAINLEANTVNSQLQVTTKTHYKYYRKDELLGSSLLEDIKPIAETIDSEYSSYITTLSCEKFLSITAKESNYFNIIQSICERFECWAKFVINVDTNTGLIADKIVELHKYIGQNNNASIKYGVNLQNITRENDSKQIVTKLMVKQNSNEFGHNGLCTIMRAPVNETGDTTLYNFDYYISQGMLSAGALQKDLYDQDDAHGKDTNLLATFDVISNNNHYFVTCFGFDNLLTESISEFLQNTSSVKGYRNNEWEDIESGYSSLIDPTENQLHFMFQSGVLSSYSKIRLYSTHFYTTNCNGYYPRLRAINTRLMQLQDKISESSSSLTRAESDKTVAEVGLESAESNLEKAINAFRDALGFDYTDIRTITNSSSCISVSSDRKTVTYDQSNSQSAKLSFINQVKVGSTLVNSNPYKVQYDTTNQTWTVTFYQALANGTVTIAENRMAKVNDSKYSEYLREITIYLQNKAEFSNKLIQATLAYNQYYENLSTLKNEFQEKLVQKTLLNRAFYQKYHRYIHEGTWIDESYIDDTQYYIDAVSTLYNSCYPKVSYNISMIELSGLSGYEDFTFSIGDKTYIEDIEFFGKDSDGYVHQEEVIISELSYSLDDPSKNTIKVQTYRSEFADLFQQISAAVQSVQYQNGAFQRAAQVALADNEYKAQFINNALEKAGAILNAGSTVTQDAQGILITSETTNKKVRIAGGGILLGQRDENTDTEKWVLGITADGISADLITAGKINTGEIRICNGDDDTFRWDAHGLTAYYYESGSGTYIENLTATKGIRFDHFGLYGYEGIDGRTWNPASLDDINDYSKFSLTWEGLKVETSTGSVHIGKDTNALIQIKKGNTPTFTVSQNGDVTIAGTLDGATGTFSGSLAVKDGSNQPLFVANNSNSTWEGVSAHSVKIAGWNVSANALSTGTWGNDGYVLLSKGDSTNASAITNGIPALGNGEYWALVCGKYFGVKTNGYFYANQGEIGGWTISSDSIYTGTTGSNNSTKISTTNFSGAYAGQSSSISNWRMTIGSQFGITADGVLYATGVNISGTIESTNGHIGGWSIGNSSLTNYQLSSSSGDGTTYSTPLILNSGIALFSEDQDEYYKIIDATSKAWRICIGNDFGVTSSGTLYARNARISGTLTSATIDGIVTVQSALLSNDTEVWLTQDSTYDNFIFNVGNNGIQYFRGAGLGAGTITNHGVSFEQAILGIARGTGSSSLDQLYNHPILSYCNTIVPNQPYGSRIYLNGATLSLRSYRYLLESQQTTARECIITLNTGAINENSKITLKADQGSLQGTWQLNNAAITTSDRNKKNSIENLSSAYTSLFDNLIPKRFKYNDGTSNRYHLGFIAQEVTEAIEKAGLTSQDAALVCQFKEEDGYSYGLRYSEIIALCVDQIQQLKAEIRELKSKIPTK